MILYYELYVGGSVATRVIADYRFTFTQFILILVVGNAIGACASLLAGLADRWGRANLVVGGLLLTGLLIALGILVVVGLLSDKLRVRKPLMLVGGIVAAASTAAFAITSKDLSTSYYTFALLFVIGAAGGGMAYVAWMTAFTETVEKHNPAATATGLASLGWIVRVVVTVSYAVLLVVGLLRSAAVLPAVRVRPDRSVESPPRT